MLHGQLAISKYTIKCDSSIDGHGQLLKPYYTCTLRLFKSAGCDCKIWKLWQNEKPKQKNLKYYLYQSAWFLRAMTALLFTFWRYAAATIAKCNGIRPAKKGPQSPLVSWRKLPLVLLKAVRTALTCSPEVTKLRIAKAAAGCRVKNVLYWLTASPASYGNPNILATSMLLLFWIILSYSKRITH